jgi:hypothetical protein
MTESIHLAELSNAASATFDNIGDSYSGQIVAVSQRNQTDLNTGEVRTFKSGEPRQVLVITLQPEEGEAVALWAKGGSFTPAEGEGTSMLNALVGAIRAVGGQSVRVGDHLTMTLTGLGQKKAKNMSPAKLYTAVYELGEEPF